MTTTRSAELNVGVWTSWLPVTTAWPSDPACDTAVWARLCIQPEYNYLPYIFDPAYGESVANTPTCLPPAATQWWNGDLTSTSTITHFSMGPVVCPEAYSTVSTSVVAGTSTSIICCPSNYDFVRGISENGGIDGVCTSTIAVGQSLQYVCPAEDANSFTTATTTYTALGTMIAVPVEGYNFAASTTSSTAAPTSTEPSDTSISSTPSATGTNTHSDGLSTGAKAGIGVGVAALVLLIGALVAFMLMHRRMNRTDYMAAPTQLPANETMAEVSGQRGEKPPTLNQKPVEVDGNSRPLVELQ